MKRTILLAGATGLVGGHLRRKLQGGGHTVHLLLRRPIDKGAANEIQHVADTSEWPDIIAGLSVDCVISTLGTTIKIAGSRQAMWAIDHDLVVATAAAARSVGALHCIAVSSVSANPSAANFYMRMKGTAEKSLQSLDFDRLDILRPGLLIGDREGPFRLGESLAMRISPFVDPLMLGNMSRYRSIRADAVAGAIAALIDGEGDGTHILHHDEIMGLVRERDQ
jgi:uncharacterized protein YbjT (DUF2867 family)